ncbi:MAG: hypothetical protein ABFR32_07820 [Bacteroidota bacterium]
MRKQYHFRPSKNGFYAWDIGKLVEKAKDFSVISVKLEDIKELDENYWYNDYPKNLPTCRSIVAHFKLMEETDLNYPIILCEDGRVMDGMHRVCKALLLGLTEINALKFKKTPDPDFVDVYAEDLPYD